MRSHRWLGLLLPALALIVASALTAASPAAAEPIVDFELVTESGFPLTGAQRWLDTLKDLGADSLRIRSGRSGDRVEVKQRGSDAAPRYLVTGILTANNTLALPGGTFSIRESGRIREWITRLKEGGSDGVTKPLAAFGMTGTQLVAVHQALAVPVTFSTKDKPTIDVAREISKLISLELTVDPAAKRALAGQETVTDELQGLSAGTALAAAIRPLGLVMAPFKPRGADPRLLITDVRSAEQSWPVGWPSEKPPGKTMPKLFEFLTVEIDDFVLNDALAAIGQRLDAPMLLDHNSLARHDIDPASAKVSFPKGRTFYKKIIDRLLYQAKLKNELRVDEAGTAFLWITTIKR